MTLRHLVIGHQLFGVSYITRIESWSWCAFQLLVLTSPYVISPVMGTLKLFPCESTHKLFNDRYAVPTCSQRYLCMYWWHVTTVIMHTRSSGSSVGRAVDCSRYWRESVIHRSLVQIRPGGNFFTYCSWVVTRWQQSLHWYRQNKWE